jgi:hypothetical protein
LLSKDVPKHFFRAQSFARTFALSGFHLVSITNLFIPIFTTKISETQPLGTTKEEFKLPFSTQKGENYNIFATNLNDLSKTNL